MNFWVILHYGPCEGMCSYSLQICSVFTFFFYYCKNKRIHEVLDYSSAVTGVWPSALNRKEQRLEGQGGKKRRE